jgi:hypothetical protein
MGPMRLMRKVCALDGYDTTPPRTIPITSEGSDTGIQKPPIGIELAKRRTDGYGIEQGGEVFCLGGWGSVRHTPFDLATGIHGSQVALCPAWNGHQPRWGFSSQTTHGIPPQMNQPAPA